ncbi:MAG: transposase [Phyllobacteriaceae bacterium]|nr:transposase [Phyllobacteriaceae bacterium]
MGGKDKNKHAKDRKGKRGPFGGAIVWGALERDGELRTFHLHTLKQVKDAVRSQVKAGELVISDEYSGYRGLSGNPLAQDGKSQRGTVCPHWKFLPHQLYRRRMVVISNGRCMAFNHWISDKHLARYLAEMTWRYNEREALAKATA